MRPTNLDIGLLRLDGGTQSRITIDKQVVEEYAVDMREGVKFKPIEVYHDGTTYWLVDGFHRVAAAGIAEKEKLPAIIKKGTQQEAIWASLAANKDHGLRRKNKDKRRAVALALEARPNMSDNAIAEHVGVSNHLVKTVRGNVGTNPASENSDIQLSGSIDSPTGPKRIGRDGKLHPPSPYIKKTVKTYFNDPPKPAPKPPAKPTPPAASEPSGPIPMGDPPAPAVKDQLGQIVTGDVADIFRRRDEISGLMRQLSDIRTRVQKAVEAEDPLFADINASHFQASCGNAYRELRAVRPHALCPYCGGEGCDGCHTHGWVGEFVYKHAPKEGSGK